MRRLRGSPGLGVDAHPVAPQFPPSPPDDLVRCPLSAPSPRKAQAGPCAGRSASTRPAAPRPAGCEQGPRSTRKGSLPPRLNSVGAGGSAAGRGRPEAREEQAEPPRAGRRSPDTHPSASSVSSTSPSIVGSGPGSGPRMVLGPKDAQRSKASAGNQHRRAKVPARVLKAAEHKFQAGAIDSR